MSQFLFKGNFLGGEITGHFRKVWKDPGRKQLYYEGSFVNGIQHGPGKIVFKDGSQYRGSFQQVLQSFDEMISQCFCAVFRNNQMHGSGVFLQDHGIYKGCFQSNMKEGEGVFQWKSSPWCYSGCFHQDAAEGHGKMSLQGELVYEGRFSRGAPEHKPVRIRLSDVEMVVSRGEPINVGIVIEDERSQPVRGFHKISCGVTAWYKYQSLPEEDGMLQNLSSNRE